MYVLILNSELDTTIKWLINMDFTNPGYSIYSIFGEWQTKSLYVHLLFSHVSDDTEQKVPDVWLWFTDWELQTLQTGKGGSI